MRLLTICGSLRARSSNGAILAAYARLAAPAVEVVRYDGLGALPHFNPDLDGEEPPAEVAEWRRLVTAADALAISTPEYVHALPGSFKNALDWLVSDPSVVGKPVAILDATGGGSWALASLREVLTTMSARIVEAASVSLKLGSNRIDEEDILAREDLRKALKASVAALIAELEKTG